MFILKKLKQKPIICCIEPKIKIRISQKKKERREQKTVFDHTNFFFGVTDHIKI